MVSGSFRCAGGPRTNQEHVCRHHVDWAVWPARVFFFFSFFFIFPFGASYFLVLWHTGHTPPGAVQRDNGDVHQTEQAREHQYRLIVLI